MSLQTAEASHPEGQAMVLEEHAVKNTDGKSYISLTNLPTDHTQSDSTNPDPSLSLHPSLCAFRIGMPIWM